MNVVTWFLRQIGFCFLHLAKVWHFSVTELVWWLDSLNQVINPIKNGWGYGSTVIWLIIFMKLSGFRKWVHFPILFYWVWNVICFNRKRQYSEIKFLKYCWWHLLKFLTFSILKFVEANISAGFTIIKSKGILNLLF
jgi:hypothetical protein